MRQLRLALRMLRRDLLAGEVKVLVIALLVAVASVSAVGFFTDRIQQALEIQANELLGADLVVGGSEPPAREYAQRAGDLRLRYSETLEFPSMVVAGERNELASVKAVSAGYPLRGSLRTAPQLFAADALASGVPAPGTVWIESRLGTALGVDVGAEVSLGAMHFRVAAILTSEPARAAGNLFAIAPRLLFNAADVAATQLVAPGSRVRYSALFAGPADRITQLRHELESERDGSQRIQGIDDARPEVRSALDRAGRFLGLAALVSVLLAGVAVGMATRRFSARHLDACAVMRCLGAQQRDIVAIYAAEIGLLGAGGIALGLVLGFLGQYVLVAMLAAVADVVLPGPSWRPVVLGGLTGLVTVLGFAVPPLLALKDVAPLRVLRRDLPAPAPRVLLTYGVGLAAFGVLVLAQAGDLKLGMYVLGGVAAAVLSLAGLAAVLVRACRHLAPRIGLPWRLGVSNITRRAGGSAVQVVAFGLGLMALLLLTIVRADLLDDWLDKLPPETPNRFLINIQPDQVAALQQFFTDTLGAAPELYPMVRGRLVGINERGVTPEDFDDDRARRLVEREFNLSWAAELRADNTLSSGTWWADESSGAALSVEEGLAQTLHIKLGDRLRFRVAANEFEAPVTNLRKVDWDSFRVNFFVLASPGTLSAMPATYISSFYLPADKSQILNQLLKRFPNVTVIDVAAVMEQVRGIIGRVSQAVEYVFVFTLAAGLMVLYAAIQASLDERIHETAVLRTLGARRGQVWRALIIEFAALGVLAGLVAALAASTVGWVLAERIFQLPYEINPWIWIAGVVAGGVGVGVAGVIGTRGVLARPPLRALRAAE